MTCCGLPTVSGVELTDPGPDKTAYVETAFAASRDFMRDDDPRTGDRVRPGPLQRLLP
jgi:hypothetical protein